jgi:hypothetical protein
VEKGDQKKESKVGEEEVDEKALGSEEEEWS